ncbi:MAG: SMP-30/gluconolactonase/LRE family protein [Byssovorax sp.]
MKLASLLSSRFVSTFARVVAAAAIATVAAVAAPADASNPIGQGAVRSLVPSSPGFPEGIVVDQDRYFVSGPATFGTAGQGPSTVNVFSKKTGALQKTIAIQGEATQYEHALSCITADDQGRLYALSTQLGVVRLTEDHKGRWTQQIYAPSFPMLPSCYDVEPGETCSPKLVSALPPIPNDLAFDDDGNLYVTDSFQATIFRIPAGGGEAQIWFQSPALVSPPGMIGLNGLRIGPHGNEIYFTVTATLASGGGEGVIYKLPLVDQPAEEDLELVHSYPAGEGPDGIAFGQHGKLYVALAMSNQVSVLNRHGAEINRLSGPGGSAIPFDAPANVAFDHKGSLLVVNHALFTRNPSHMAVLQVFVGDNGETGNGGGCDGDDD